MNMKCCINRSVLIVLLGLFIWQTILAILKYMERTTITSSNNRDEGSILFPSITVCKNYLNGPNYLQIKNENVKVETLNRNLYNKIWSKKQVFYFFSHPNMFNLSFPCTTKEGIGTTPGKPCMFPHGHGHKCTEYKNCFTRWKKERDGKKTNGKSKWKYEQMTFGRGKYDYWGECKPQCKGENPGPTSKYNLARNNKSFNTAWSNGLYNLGQYDAGFCYTYDPPQKSGSGVSNGLYFMLGHDGFLKDYDKKKERHKKDSSFMMYSFDIYLHEKDQFWLKSGMDTLGQFGPVSVLPDREVTGTFTVNTIKALDRPGHHCESDEAYSYTACLRSYVTRTANCSMDLLAKESNCTPRGVHQMYQILNEIKLSSKKTTIKMTGCLPKCITRNYHFQEGNNENATWSKEWISSFYLSTLTTVDSISEESYSYDEQDLIGAIGGYLGLFLGWSVMSFVTEASSWANIILKIIKSLLK